MPEAMDNFRVHVIARSYKTLAGAVKLGFSDYKNTEYWSEVKDNDGSVWLSFYWHKPNFDVNKLPSKLTEESIIPTIEAWLEEHPPTTSKPDLDGSVSHGFELKANFGGGWSYEIFRVRAIWAEHHK